ncbi:uncharacterized protein LOC127043956 [Gopherus flavomarginatus]|uniref:uncharacterized protein LOC127043956 n=1 Tax=Gopherus flavomarginatus TaxID=286002 RepID=UPI0021CBA86C|nr:uncharacterized protein LOC127043956 [Gopherus flavomarginatus]
MNCQNIRKSFKGHEGQRGHNRDTQQCHVKIKEQRQAYHKTREANGRSGAEPQTCHFYAELHAIPQPCALTPSMENDTTPKRVWGMRKMMMKRLTIAHSKEAEKLVSPTAKICFSPWTWSQYPSNPPKAGSRTLRADKGPLRLAKIKRLKKCTRDEMFSELLLSSYTDRAHQNVWRQMMSECKKAQQNTRRGGRLKSIGDISLLTEGKSRCSNCWSIKLICSSIRLSCRKGCRSTDCCYSPCVTNHPPPQGP